MIFLGIDCGTQSTKVIVWNPDRSEIAVASRSYGLIEDLPPGHKEQDPAVWIQALEDCVQELKARGVDLAEIRGIGVSGQQHGLVVLDGSDRVIRPAKLWNDTSTQRQCDDIIQTAGGIQTYQEEIGNGLPPGFTASKILWIARHEPESYRQIRSIMLPHDYLNFYLTGEKVAEAGDASGTGYFRVRQREWSRRALSWIDPNRDLSPCLPRVIRSDEPAGALRLSLARKWGLSSPVVVSSGGGDNMMGAIGSGNVADGVLTVSLGTSGTLYSYSSVPVVDPKGEIAAFCDSTGGWLPLGCTMNVTVATEMIRRGMLETDHAGFDQQVGHVAAGSDGLVFLPYLEGERMPNVPLGTGLLLGLRPKTATRAHLARAAMEGVTLGLRYGLERFKELGLHPSEARLIGGGAKSPVWRQICADIFGLPVVCPLVEEGPAFGAAVQALWAFQGGSVTDLAARFVNLDENSRTGPSPGAVAAYNRVYDVYDALSRTLTESTVFAAHRELIETT